MEKADLDAVNELIAKFLKPLADAVKPMADSLKSLTDNQKVLADTMAADKQAATDARKLADDAKASAASKDDAGKAKPLTLEDVGKLVSEKMTSVLGDFQKTQQTGAARGAYIAEKLKDVPAQYHSLLGSAADKWKEEEQKIRDTLKSDLAAMGFKPKDVAGGNAGGSTASSATSEEKVTAFKAQGLSDGEAAFAVDMKMPA